MSASHVTIQHVYTFTDKENTLHATGPRDDGYRRHIVCNGSLRQCQPFNWNSTACGLESWCVRMRRGEQARASRACQGSRAYAPCMHGRRGCVIHPREHGCYLNMSSSFCWLIWALRSRTNVAHRWDAAFLRVGEPKDTDVYQFACIVTMLFFELGRATPLSHGLVALLTGFRIGKSCGTRSTGLARSHRARAWLPAFPLLAGFRRTRPLQS